MRGKGGEYIIVVWIGKEKNFDYWIYLCVICDCLIKFFRLMVNEF